jgi:cell division protein FtsL
MKKNNNMKVLKTYIFIAILVLFAGTSVFLTIETVATGSEVSSLSEKGEELSAKQRELKESLVRGVSTTSLEEKSKDLGFTQASNVIYITNNESVAAR